MDSTAGSMQTTEKNLNVKKQQSEPKPVAKTPALVSGEKSLTSEKPSTSESLSKNLATELMGLIRKVNENGVTAETVNASCNAAAQIHKILRLNFDMKKDGF